MEYLEDIKSEMSIEVLEYLKQCEPHDFKDFSKEEWINSYKRYYRLLH
ncbi:hypothetical protein ABIA61_000783 [Paenibacillus sp. RC21]